jgi:hypothetical protein
MGRRIVKVPAKFEHPKDPDGDYIPGAHHEILYSLLAQVRDCFQIYEDVSEGTPVSPIFPTEEALRDWLGAKGDSFEAINSFIETGHAPSFVLDEEEGLIEGIQGMEKAREDETEDSGPNE